MPKPRHARRYRRYNKESFGKSVFDGNPTLIVNRYIVPSAYKAAVDDVLTAYKSGISFNKAVDQAAALDAAHINRDKLAVHALKTIANDY